MIDQNELKNNFEMVRRKLSLRNFDVRFLDKARKTILEKNKVIQKVENLREKKNKLSADLKGMEKSEREKIIKKVQLIKNEIEKLNTKEIKLKKEVRELLLQIPNIPADDVPVGKDEKENKVLYKKLFGKKLITKVIPHYQICENLNICDLKTTSKVFGSRFWMYKNKGAKLVRALINFMIDIHTKNGYEEFNLPVLVKESSLIGTGQLPKFYDDLYKIENNDLWLIPTAEVSLTNFFSNQILDLSKPIKVVSYSPCFRQEAGARGKDNKGLIRGHQFNKVELVKIVSQKDLEKEFNSTVKDAEKILEELQIPYRAVLLSTGDLGFSSEKTVDLEIWIPSEGKFREISSISSFGTFQARRAMIREREENRNIFATTINGSGLAIDRLIAAILENFQKNNKVIIPKKLVPLLGFSEI